MELGKGDQGFRVRFDEMAAVGTRGQRCHDAGLTLADSDCEKVLY